MEFAGGGDLSHVVQHCKKNRLRVPESDVIRYFYQLLSALKTLHRNNIIHRDLKSANIFLSTDKKSVKLGDMNVSKILKQDFASTQTGTPYYASPEVWRDEDYNVKADIWSLGCVIFELCNLKQPFQASGLDRLFKKVQNKNIEKFERGYSHELQGAVHECLTLDYQKRPCARQMMEMPIFDEVKRELKEERLMKEEQEGAKTKGRATSNESDRMIKMNKRVRKRWGMVVRDGDSGSEPIQSIMETIPVDLDFKSLAQRLPKARYSHSTDKTKTKETFEHKRSKSGIARRKMMKRSKDSDHPTPLAIKERMREMKKQRMRIVEHSRRKIQERRRKLGSKRENKIQKHKRLSVASGVSLQSGDGMAGNDARRRKRHLEMLKVLGAGQGLEIGKSLMRERKEQERILSKLEICHSQLVKRDSNTHKHIKKQHMKTEGAQQINRIMTNESNIPGKMFDSIDKLFENNLESDKCSLNKIMKNDSLNRYLRMKNQPREKSQPGVPSERSPSNPSMSRQHIETKLKMMKEEVSGEMSRKRDRRTGKGPLEVPTTKTRKGGSGRLDQDKGSLVMVNHKRHRELVRKLFDNSVSREVEVDIGTRMESKGYLMKNGKEGNAGTSHGKENVYGMGQYKNPKEYNNRYNQVQINHQYIENSIDPPGIDDLEIVTADPGGVHQIEIQPNLEIESTQDLEKRNLKKKMKEISLVPDKSRNRKKKMMKIAGLKLELNNSYNLLRPVGNTTRGRIREAVRGEGKIMLEHRICKGLNTPTENQVISPEETEQKKRQNDQPKFYVDKISYTFSKKENVQKRVSENIEKKGMEGNENVNMSNERRYQSQKDGLTKIGEHAQYLSQNRKGSSQFQKTQDSQAGYSIASNLRVASRSRDRLSGKSAERKIQKNVTQTVKENLNHTSKIKTKVLNENMDEYNFKGGLPRIKSDFNQLPQLTLEEGNVVLKENSKKENEQFLSLMGVKQKHRVESTNTPKGSKSKLLKRKKFDKNQENPKKGKKSQKVAVPNKNKNQHIGVSENDLKRLNKKRHSKMETKTAKNQLRNESKYFTGAIRKKSVNKVLRKKKETKKPNSHKTNQQTEGDSRVGHIKSVSGNESSKISRNSKSTSITSTLKNERRKNLRKHKMLIQRLNTIETSGVPAYSKKGRLSRPAGQSKINKPRGGKFKNKRAGSDRPIGHTGRNGKKSRTQTLSICDQIDNIIDSSAMMLGPRTPKNYASKVGNRQNHLSKKIGQTFKNLNSRSGIHKNINSWQNRSNQLCLNLLSDNSRPKLPGPLSIYSRRAKDYKPDFQNSMRRVGHQAYTSKNQKDSKHYVPFKQYVPEKISKIERLGTGKRGGSSQLEAKTKCGSKVSSRGPKIPKSTRNMDRRKGKPKSLSQLGKSGAQRRKVNKNTSNYQFPSSYTLQTLHNGSHLYNLPSNNSIPSSYSSKIDSGLYQKRNIKEKQMKMMQGASTGAMESLANRKKLEKEGYPAQIISGDLGGGALPTPMAGNKKPSFLTQKLSSMGVGKGTKTPKNLGSKGTPKGGSFSTRHLLSLQSKYNSKFKSHMNISQKIKPISLFKNKDYVMSRINSRNSNLASQIEARTQFKSKKGRSPKNGDFAKRGKGKEKKGIFMDKSFMESLMQNGPSMNLSSKFLNSRQSNRIASRKLK